jgi:hypothetical protein
MKLVIASRLHLGRANSPPSDEQIQKILENLGTMAASIDQYEASVVIAVDASPKIKNYDYVKAIRNVLTSMKNPSTSIEILPVTPWGKFVPALNALVLYAKSQLNADLLMFASAEVSASTSTVSKLCQHVTADDKENVIVAGAAMKGHDYQGPGQTVVLTGR